MSYYTDSVANYDYLDSINVLTKVYARENFIWRGKCAHLVVGREMLRVAPCYDS